jgi:uncharacterized protein
MGCSGFDFVIYHAWFSHRTHIFTPFKTKEPQANHMGWIEIGEYLLVLATGFLVGFINTLAGSGSLLTLPLLIWLGLDPLMANGTNRIAILMQGATGVAAFHRKGQFRYRHDLRYIVPAVVGSLPGAFIAVDLNNEAMSTVIAIVMLLMLVIMVFNPQKRFNTHGAHFPGKVFVIMVVFFFIGMYGGFIQAGVGIFILAGLSLLDQMELLRANAVKVLITTIFTLAVIPVFLAHDHVDWFYGILLGAGSMGGTLLSVKMAVKRGNRFLKIVLYTVISATAIYMLIKNGG